MLFIVHILEKLYKFIKMHSTNAKLYCCACSQGTLGRQDICLKHQQQCFYMLIRGDDAGGQKTCSLPINKVKKMQIFMKWNHSI